jgi:hypothetical protein
VSVPHRSHEVVEGADVDTAMYRQLYEGSQRSLTEMAMAQSLALAQHKKLRKGILTLMRRNFPQEYMATERKTGRPLTDFEDDVLLAYLGMFMGALTSVERYISPPGAEALREALVSAGIKVPTGTDLSAWAAIIATTTTAHNPPPADADLDLPAQPIRPNSATQQERQPKQPLVKDPADLVDLFDADEPAPPPRVRTGRRDRAAAVPPQTAPAPGNDGPQTLSDDDLESLFGPDPEYALDALFDEAIAEIQEIDAAELSGGQVPIPTTSSEPTEPAPPTPSAAPPTTTSDVIADVVISPPSLRPQLRPELFPGGGIPKAKSRKGTNRTVRTQALPADPADFDVPNQGAGRRKDVPDEADTALINAVRLPRPMFTGDLIPLVGSAEVVEAWEESCRNDSASTFRFIPPKARHRSLGALVLPYADKRQMPSDFTQSLWGKLQHYKRARIYELGVILRKVGEDVVSHHVGTGVVTLRLSQPRGLVGMVLVTAADISEGTPALSELVDTVDELLTERLSSVVTLMVNDAMMESAVSALATAASVRGWTPTMPVIAAYSWEYASDQGQSATLVLGG